MNIDELQVINSRNLHNVRAEFRPGLNLIYGANAQGKTNLLEAIYLLVTGRSFRTVTEREMIPWVRDDYEATIVRARVSKHSGVERFLVTFNQREKNVIVNGEPISRLGELVGRINAVLFTPSDMDLVRGAPASRRRFMDIELCQVSRQYLYHLQRYDHALRQRNSMLKQQQNRPQLRDDLHVWDEQLALHGGPMIFERRQMLTQLSPLAQARYETIANRREELQLVYRSSPSALAADANRDQLSDQLRRAFAISVVDDARRGATSLGPHRDDFEFLLAGRSAHDFGSQGQQRSCVLALKLAELEYMEKITREPPLLLLDDLMSELDEQRRGAFLGSLEPRIQTFLTTTEKEPVLSTVSTAAVFHMDGGQLTPEQ